MKKRLALLLLALLVVGCGSDALEELNKVQEENTKAGIADADAIKAEADFSKGVDFADRTDRATAIACFTEAIRLNPDYAGAFRHRGNAHFYEGEPDKAIADFTEAIRIKPEDVLAHVMRGFAYTYIREFDKAIADYTEAIRLDPTNAVAYYNRGIAYKVKGDMTKAAPDLIRGRELGFQD